LERLIIVGGGLFGSLAARLAAEAGHQILLIDSLKPYRASPAAAGVWRDGWIKKLGDEGREGVEVLRRLGVIRRLKLWSSKGPLDASFVPPSALLCPVSLNAEVASVEDGVVHTRDKGSFEGLVYVAAGIWTRHLVPQCPIVSGRYGAALLFRGGTVPRIETWAPYRQSLAFVRDAGSTYFSDGTAVVASSWGLQRIQETAGRAAEMGLTRHVDILAGARPYAAGGPWFARVGRRTWAATGGEKSGTVLGAAFAARLMREIVA
jgi:hypothetical protein